MSTTMPRTLFALIFCFGVLSCNAADSRFQQVSFEASDGGRIQANLYGEGSHGVVLAHGAVFNKESWDSQAVRLADQGLRVLAIDFRGYGVSTVGSEGRALHLDILAAGDYLKQIGCNRVSVVGGSMGGGAAAQAAVLAESGAIHSLILLAHSPIPEPARMQGDKLFIVSEGDGIHRRVEQQFHQAGEPKKLVILKGAAHAQHIFKTDQSEDLFKLISDWLTK